MKRVGVTDSKKLDRDSWDNINNEFWDDYNEPFLEDAFKRGDNIRLLFDPVKAKSGTYESELKRIGDYKNSKAGDLLLEYGYEYDKLTATYKKVRKGTKE